MSRATFDGKQKKSSHRALFKKLRAILNTGAFLAFSKSTLIEIQNGQVTTLQITRSGETFQKGKVIHRTETGA